MKPDERREGDSFYVGYQAKAPAGIARVVRRVVIGVVAAAAGLGGVLGGAFSTPAPAEWSAVEERFEGEMVRRPYPMLRYVDKGQVKRAVLVGVGKFGLEAERLPPEGAGVRLRGTVIQRDGRVVIEVSDGPREVEDGERGEKAPESGGFGGVVGPADARGLGRLTITGEIIDPKCFLGAMKPGGGKVHKACAVRCISGGIPPMLASRNPGGGFAYYLLASADGGPVNSRVLPFVGEAVEVSGVAEAVDGMVILRLDDSPAGLRRR